MARTRIAEAENNLAVSPPDHLSEKSKALWASLVPRRAKSPERLALLTVALESLDRADAARELLAEEGMVATTATTKAVHLHPAAKLERESRAIFARIWKQLGLSWDYELDGGWPMAELTSQR